MAIEHKTDRVQGAVELGPRSLSLLRRIVLGLEEILDHQIEDPGKEYEDDSQEWPES